MERRQLVVTGEVLLNFTCQIFNGKVVYNIFDRKVKKTLEHPHIVQQNINKKILNTLLIKVVKSFITIAQHFTLNT